MVINHITIFYIIEPTAAVSTCSSVPVKLELITLVKRFVLVRVVSLEDKDHLWDKMFEIGEHEKYYVLSSIYFVSQYSRLRKILQQNEEENRTSKAFLAQLSEEFLGKKSETHKYDLHVICWT